MIHFDFSAFMFQFGLNRAFCAKVFGVSERSVTRWRQSAQIPTPAARLAMSIQLQAVPWNASMTRGVRIGMSQLAWQWRNELFAPAGGQWQDYRSPQERAEFAARAKEIRAARAAHAARIKRVRLDAGRKAAKTRAARQSARPSVDLDLHQNQSLLRLETQIERASLPPVVSPDAAHQRKREHHRLHGARAKARSAALNRVRLGANYRHKPDQQATHDA